MIKWETSNQKYLNRLGIAMAYLHVFLIAMQKIGTAAEVYLELFQSYMLELFAKIVHGLRRKGSILTGIILNKSCSYRDSIWYYKRDETRALHSSEVQINH